ncbi:Sterol 3-beta-glucosyltransferase UGT80B1 [Phytophthora citrophthora]|uniref:Sterol 3-beta-glucosyltransferase UGT80B1 n=1 Tax=Phytophthora citrophthora TaxID=4793 RepID=A0AAD9GPF9_9STRA|nr:Sterol 3-beta-glucosyltransferase UGT80B1 [Phytophthora citrophthora]
MLANDRHQVTVMGTSPQDQQNATKQWKKVVEKVNKSKRTTFADVVHAAVMFDRSGRIQMDFDNDDSNYRISSLQEHAKQCVESFHTRQTGSRTDVDAPPALAICIMIVGTQGDVQPFVAIAKKLMQDGHRVRLATHAIYRDFVMSHGVEFYPLGGDPKELAAYMVKTGGHLIPLSLEAIQKDVPRNMQMIEEIIQSTWPAVSEADPEGGGPGIPGKPFKAQAIIANPVSYGHIHVAERLGVPLHIMFPQPWVPTTAFPHPLSNMPYTGKPKKINYMTYKLVDLLMWQGTEGMVNAFRTDVLDLRKIRKGEGGRDILLDLAIPHAFMWSPHLVPKPKDWGKIYDVIGTVTLGGSGSSFIPTPELEAFLGYDDCGPIFVGFGSMVLPDPKGVIKMIVEAAEQADVRVLTQSSWSDMAGDMDVPDNIFFLGSCPHDWLMPRVSAVVHHGGAGTTAAGLLAGKPTFIVPFFGDQPFWGRAVLDAGVGVEPCPILELSTVKLHSAFEKLGSPELHQRAVELRDLMQKEDGAREAVCCILSQLARTSNAM